MKNRRDIRSNETRRESRVTRPVVREEKRLWNSKLSSVVTRKQRATARAMDVTPPTPRLKGELVRPPYVGRLSTRADWRRHSAKVWREMRRGEISPDLGARLLWGANICWAQVKADDTDASLEALRDQLEAIRTGQPLPARPAIEHDDIDDQGDGT